MGVWDSMSGHILEHVYKLFLNLGLSRRSSSLKHVRRPMSKNALYRVLKWIFSSGCILIAIFRVYWTLRWKHPMMWKSFGTKKWGMVWCGVVWCESSHENQVIRSKSIHFLDASFFSRIFVNAHSVQKEELCFLYLIVKNRRVFGE